MKKIKRYSNFINESENVYYEHNNMIDYTLLEESSSEEDIIELCRKANLLGVKSVCILPKWVKLAKKQLLHSKVLVCTVISFPKGEDSIDEKSHETTQAINDGADEIDMVLNYKLLSDDFIPENYGYLVDEVDIIAKICHMNKNKFGEPVILKVIVESGLLTNGQTRQATYVCLDGEADFIKTSTGKVRVGAELEKIKIMIGNISTIDKLKIKASGGIRTKSQIESYLPMVDRFGMGYQSVDQINGISDGESKY